MIPSETRTPSSYFTLGDFSIFQRSQIWTINSKYNPKPKLFNKNRLKTSSIEASIKIYKKKQMSVKDALVKKLKYFHFAFNSCQYVTSE